MSPWESGSSEDKQWPVFCDQRISIALANHSLDGQWGRMEGGKTGRGVDWHRKWNQRSDDFQSQPTSLSFYWLFGTHCVKLNIQVGLCIKIQDKC